MSVDADAKTIFRNYHQLLERVKKLLILVNKLAEQNRQLKLRIEQLNEKMSSQMINDTALELKDELKKLKIENKFLKERESQIKTKIDRLSVKLEKLHL